MRLPAFEYASPRSVEEGVRLLAQAGGKARLLAGGTGLLPALKRKSTTAELVVNIKGIKTLQEAKKEESGALCLGAAVSLSRLKDLAAPRAVVQAVSRIAAAELRNMGTVGGNIMLDNRCWYCDRSCDWWRGKDPCFKRGGRRCYVYPSGSQCRAAASSDLAPVLITLGAEVEIASPKGRRRVPLRELYEGDGARPHRINGEEMVTRIHVPSLPWGSGTSFRKAAKRETLDFALVNACGRIALAPDGITCREASAAISASVVLPTVLPMDCLVGREITSATLEEAVAEAMKQAGFITTAAALDVPAAYRRQTAAALLHRCLEEAWEEACREVQA